MASARDNFGPPRPQTQNSAQQIGNLEASRLAAIRQVGQSLQQAGVKTTEAVPPQQAGPKNTASGDSNDVRKDLGVAQGERPALSPDDRNRQITGQAKAQGESLKQAGVTSGQSMTAAQQFAPPPQPKAVAASPPPPSRSR